MNQTRRFFSRCTYRRSLFDAVRYAVIISIFLLHSAYAQPSSPSPTSTPSVNCLAFGGLVPNWGGSTLSLEFSTSGNMVANGYVLFPSALYVSQQGSREKEGALFLAGLAYSPSAKTTGFFISRHHGNTGMLDLEFNKDQTPGYIMRLYTDPDNDPSTPFSVVINEVIGAGQHVVVSGEIQTFTPNLNKKHFIYRSWRTTPGTGANEFREVFEMDDTLTSFNSLHVINALNLDSIVRMYGQTSSIPGSSKLVRKGTGPFIVGDPLDKVAAFGGFPGSFMAQRTLRIDRPFLSNQTQTRATLYWGNFDLHAGAIWSKIVPVEPGFDAMRVQEGGVPTDLSEPERFYIMGRTASPSVGGWAGTVHALNKSGDLDSTWGDSSSGILKIDQRPTRSFTPLHLVRRSPSAPLENTLISLSTEHSGGSSSIVFHSVPNKEVIIPTHPGEFGFTVAQTAVDVSPNRSDLYSLWVSNPSTSNPDPQVMITKQCLMVAAPVATPTATPLPPTATATAQPACTPPPCSSPNSIVCPTSNCPQGCGSICATPTPVATSTTPAVCTPPPCSSPSIITCPSGNCPGGCGSVCTPPAPTATATHTPPAAANYCVPTPPSDTRYERIKKVTLSTLHNPALKVFENDSSQISNPSNSLPYQDFTSMMIRANIGVNYTLRIDPEFTPSNSVFPESYRVWIDFNKDKRFDTSEIVFAQGPTTTAASGIINIPQGTLTGSTRIRIVQGFGSLPLACGPNSYGQTEDYTINICKNWQNQVNHFDVDNSGGVTPLDALLLLNYINGGNTSYTCDIAPDKNPAPFYDVNGDQYINALDYLALLNFLNQPPATPTPTATPVRTYCQPTPPNNTNFERIHVVQISNQTNPLEFVVNRTSTGLASLEDFSATAATATPNRTYNVRIKPEFRNGATYFESYAIWLDRNRDFTFQDDERIFSQLNTRTDAVGVLTIPQLPQGAYRLRVVQQFGSSMPRACTTNGYGQAEDYTITIP
jgi:hypothetical protein